MLRFTFSSKEGVPIVCPFFSCFVASAKEFDVSYFTD